MKLTVPVFVFVISCAALFPSLISTSFSQQLFHFESQQKARETQQSNFGNTPRVDDVPLQARQLYRDKPYKKPYSTSSVNFVVVDSMTNIFSMGSSQINPLYYDPTIDRLTFVHRGDATSYAASSGAIYYNYSSDGGSSWTRNSGALNGADSPISGRYPSGVIFSPTSNVADARFFSSYSNLYFNGSANVFGDFGVGWDSPAFSNNANSYRHAHDVSNNFSYEFETQCWSSDLNMYYTDVRRQGLTGNGPFIGLNIFKSANFASMPIAATPLGLSTPTCFNIYKILGGDFMKTSATNRSAVAAIASYLGSPPMLEVIYTVDEGNTWDGGWAGGGVDIVSPASIPELCPYKYFWMRYSNNYFSCSGDMVLDSLGYPHCLVGLQAEPQNSAGVDVVIAEIYRDASGWHGKIISHGDPQTHFVAGTLDGNGYAPYISRDASGRSFAVQYTSSDNVNENADLFLSTRYWSSWADWSSPVNITQTPSFNENVAHFSPRMRDDGSTMFTVWSAFAQPKDSTIVADAAVNRTYVLCGSYQVSIIPPPQPPPPTPPPTPTWAWAKSSTGDPSNDYATSVAVDDSGNSYAVGYYQGTMIQFGSTTLTNAGGDDMFVVKYDANGNVVWAKSSTGGGTSDEIAYGVTVDGLGNCYVAGIYGSATIQFGSTTLTNAGGADIFVVKYDASGNVVWAKSSTGGGGYDYATSITVDGSGNCYIAGYYGSSTIQFGLTTLTNAGVSDVFVVKYDVSGNVVWAKSSTGGGTSYDYANSISVDASGNSYVAGQYYTTIQFGSTTLTNAGLSDMFIVKYDANGSAVWAKSNTGGGGNYDNASSVAVDGLGNCYVAGAYSSSTIQFGTTTLTNTGGSDTFIVKYDTLGNVDWARGNIGCGTSNDVANSIAVDGGGNSYVAGSYNSRAIQFGSLSLTNAYSGWNNIFVVKYDASGNAIWIKSSTGGDTTSHKYAISIAVDGAGNNYVAGNYNGMTLQFDSATLTNAADGTADMYIAKLGNATPQTVNMSLGANWNLVSLPLIVMNNSVQSLFPGSSGIAFSYALSGYQEEHRMQNGTGYWLRFDSPQTPSFHGASVDFLLLSVITGWNLVGSISTPIAVSSIISTPPGMVTSKFFRYNGVYIPTDSLYPGNAYWVKVSGDGSLTLSSLSSEMESASHIQIAATNELPPSPPDGNSAQFKGIPKQFALGQNYPNPFNPLTVIRYSLPVASHVRLSVFNTLGQEVAMLIDGTRGAGYESAEWDASRVSSGVYFYKLEAVSVTDAKQSFVQVKKALLLK